MAFMVLSVPLIRPRIVLQGSITSAFMLELRRELGDRFERFQSLDSFEKSEVILCPR